MNKQWFVVPDILWQRLEPHLLGKVSDTCVTAMNSITHVMNNNGYSGNDRVDDGVSSLARPETRGPIDLAALGGIVTTEMTNSRPNGTDAGAQGKFC